MKIAFRSSVTLIGATALLLFSHAACSSSSSDDKSGSSGSSGSNGSNGSSGSSGGAGEGCQGDLTGCTVGSLSTSQQKDFCDTLYALIDDAPGTKYECKSGPAEGRYLTVNDKATCVSQHAPASCKLTVGQFLDCYKAAKKDACGALADDGACGPILSPSSGCGG